MTYYIDLSSIHVYVGFEHVLALFGSIVLFSRLGTLVSELLCI